MTRVEIVGAPGYVDGFRATLVPGLHEFQAGPDAPKMSVVVTDAGETLAIPSEFVRVLYCREWAPSDIYVPEALR